MSQILKLRERTCKIFSSQDSSFEKVIERIQNGSYFCGSCKMVTFYKREKKKAIYMLILEGGQVG